MVLLRCGIRYLIYMFTYSKVDHVSFHCMSSNVVAMMIFATFFSFNFDAACSMFLFER